MYRNNSGNRGYRGGRNFRSKRRFSQKRRGSQIDISKFVNRAVEVEQEVYVPQNRFSDIAINEQLKSNILRKGIKDPMPIQDQSILHLLDGKDLIGIANTGMGKTLAFLLPMIHKVATDRSQKVLIIAPTRELAEQIESEIYSLTYLMHIYSVLAIGGVWIGNQLNKLRRDHNFVIGTPGRLKDLVNRKALDLSKYNNIVLDEVDRMFDMGFSEDIKFLLNLVPKERQSLFFSATITSRIEVLINQHSKNPVRVSVKLRDTSASVDQDIVRITDKSRKLDVLQDLLSKEEFKKILIFDQTKIGVHKLAQELQTRGFKAESIHGDKTQGQRQKALRMFKEGHVNILVATDVAARGLDIPQVTHVINYAIPENYEDYIHRIGRTGRANNTGKALTFV